MNVEAITQRIDDLEKKVTAAATERDCEGRHRRQGETAAELKLEVDRIGAEQRKTAHELDIFRRTPIDATKLILSTRSIIGLVGACIAIVLSLWRVSAKVDATNAKMDEQQALAAADVKVREANERLRDLQMKQLSDALALTTATADKAARQYELLRYDLQAAQPKKGK